jgi:hypothetical protein
MAPQARRQEKDWSGARRFQPFRGDRRERADVGLTLDA